MARLLENHSLDLLRKYGVRVPDYEVVPDPAAAAAALANLGGRAVIKALVPVGRRGKAGAVKFVSSPEEARAEAERILGLTVRNFPVTRLLVMEAVDIEREFFLSITFDPRHRSPLVLFSAEGGIEIEELVAEHPKRLFELPVDITRGLEVYQAIDLAERAGLAGPAAVQCGRVMHGLYRLFRSTDSQMVEVNPLAELADGRVIAAAGVVNIDEQAFFRHPDLEEKFGEEEGNGWRPFTPLEKEMRRIDSADLSAGRIRFGEMDGDIGFMVTGGGYGLSALSHLIENGGRPACTFDVTPGLGYEEKMYGAVKALLKKPGLRGLVLAGNVANFTRLDIKVGGFARALKEAMAEGWDFEKFPVVLRFAGPGIEEARQAVADIPGIDWYEHEASLEDICERILERVYGKDRGEGPR